MNWILTEKGYYYTWTSDYRKTLEKLEFAKVASLCRITSEHFVWTHPLQRLP